MVRKGLSLKSKLICSYYLINQQELDFPLDCMLVCGPTG